MYRIGEFSKIVNTSIQTLRYYNQLDLLIPKEIDKYTNYRYYNDSNIIEYKIIILLKELGFSLEEIRKYKDNLTEEMLISKKEEIIAKIYNLKESIKKIDNIREEMVNGKTIKIILEKKEEDL